jgi:signal transduction histidine kinase
LNSTSSSPSKYKTDVWYGAEEVVNRSLEIIYSIENQCDLCIPSNGPISILSENRIREAYRDLKKKGIPIRIITDVTNDNLDSCEELSKIAEIGHLSEISGSFVIGDGKNFGAVATVNEVYPPIEELIYSNVPGFAKQQQLFFEMLWRRTISLEERLTEIREGVMPDIIETLKEPSETINLAYRLIRSAKDEILIIFHTANALYRNKKSGGIDILVENVIKYKTRVKILVPIEDKIRDMIHRLERINGVEIRNIEPSMQTRMTILVIDRTYSLVVELKDDTKDDLEEAVGLATYSSSKSTVLSYVSIFDTLWRQSELREELMIRSLAQKEFINNAAHELRNPIQPILGLSDALQHSDTTKRQKEMIDIIARNARRLQHLTEDILDVTRIDGKMLKLKKESFLLGKTIREVVEDYSIDIRNSNRNITLSFSSSKELESTGILADENRIKQVICNLIDNAIKFTEEGTITVTTEIDNKRNQIVVKIRDTGKGIDSDILPILFTKFVTRSDRGTGLGLYICKGIIEAHGGSIWAENNSEDSTEGVGATFSFGLPLAYA